MSANDAAKPGNESQNGEMVLVALRSKRRELSGIAHRSGAARKERESRLQQLRYKHSIELSELKLQRKAALDECHAIYDAKETILFACHAKNEKTLLGASPDITSILENLTEEEFKCRSTCARLENDYLKIVHREATQRLVDLWKWRVFLRLTHPNAIPNSILQKSDQANIKSQSKQQPKTEPKTQPKPQPIFPQPLPSHAGANAGAEVDRARAIRGTPNGNDVLTNGKVEGDMMAGRAVVIGEMGMVSANRMVEWVDREIRPYLVKCGVARVTSVPTGMKCANAGLSFWYELSYGHYRVTVIFPSEQFPHGKIMMRRPALRADEGKVITPTRTRGGPIWYTDRRDPLALAHFLLTLPNLTGATRDLRHGLSALEDRHKEGRAAQATADFAQSTVEAHETWLTALSDWVDRREQWLLGVTRPKRYHCQKAHRLGLVLLNRYLPFVPKVLLDVITSFWIGS
jgi:hypothetical protein